MDRQTETRVAIKRIQLQMQDAALGKQSYRELFVMMQLEHKNVRTSLPFLPASFQYFIIHPVQLSINIDLGFSSFICS